ncbi:iron-containing alcohol dehydrogenase [Maridesulfovibrio sp.]|uniref:iron-containing alcohol dehydrogenase n=1 Tax=Maridesulfovibrio sp. TaxID=2795000 RepID=UPI002A18D935|nr:iron-containing alcohol dehydrogenase [Maridesulfovibrio sp.]
MQFQFSTAQKIIFGPGSAKAIPDHVSEMGKKVCLVTGHNPDRLQWLQDSLSARGVYRTVIPVSGEPETGFISECATKARAEGCDMVVAVGGGSVLDAGKAIAALLPNKRDVLDYLEVVGKGLPLENRPAPLIAAPTTAGTGSEVTANAVLLSPEHGVKISMRSMYMIPDLAIVDPELTLSMPPEVTAATGLDALTQLMESFVSRFASPMTSPLCREGMYHAADALGTAYKHGNNIEARSSMSLAGLLSGAALANAGLGAVHGFAAPLGGQLRAAHGAICAALLPQVMEINIRALRERDKNNPAINAYTETARILTCIKSAAPEDGVEWVRNLCSNLKIPGLAAIGLKENDFPDLAAKASRASSMKGNPITLTETELIEILQKSL